MKNPLSPLTSFAAFALALSPGGAPAQASQYFDDFKDGMDSWNAGSAWFVQGEGSTAVLTADTQADAFAWNSGIPLGSSWVIETEFTFENLYNDGNWTGTAGIALANSQSQLLHLADVIYSQDAWLYPGLAYYTGEWHNTLEPREWHPSAQNQVKLRLERPHGSDRLLFTVTCPNRFRRQFTSLPMPAFILNQITQVGLRGFRSRVNFHYVNVVTPLPSVVELNMYPGMSILGEPGSQFEIQSADSVEAAEWNTLTNLTLEGSRLIWFDTSATNASRRFYRAIEQ